jgi:hypothetical protein
MLNVPVALNCSLYEAKEGDETSDMGAPGSMGAPDQSGGMPMGMAS